MMISLNVSVMPFINTVVSAVFNLRCLYYLGLMYRPLLGSIDTPWPEVEAFYRFWRDFKSWRVYNANDEYNPEVIF